MPDRMDIDGMDLSPDRRRVERIEVESYHDRCLRRKKRNPIFRFWFWLESRRLRRG